MNRLWYDRKYRQRVKSEIERLRPWYHPHWLAPGIRTRPWSRSEFGIWLRAERGVRKWRRFVLPRLPVPLTSATVLELGTNSGLNCFEAIRGGAKMALGIEPDELYHDQARFLRRILPEGERIRLFRDLPSATTWIQTHRPDGVDLGLCLAVLRHVSACDRVATVRTMGELCRYVVIQGNGLPSAPDGDDYESIVSIVKSVGLTVRSWHREAHVRGLVVVCRGNR